MYNREEDGFGRRAFLALCGALPLAASCGLGDPADEHFETLRSSNAVTVFEPDAGQTLTKAQHCSVSGDIGELLEVGDQVRIIRSVDEYALYTVVEIRDQDGPGVVRMGASGRLRLAATSAFSAELDTIVDASWLTDAEAKAQSEFVERLGDDGVHDSLVVLAPHGGKMEAYTDRQAERVAAALPQISSWVCKGWRSPKGAFSRWHITSTELSPNSLPGLGAIADRGFAYAVSFHGKSGSGVSVGGRAPVELREALRAAIISAIDDPGIAVVVSDVDAPLSGVGPTNLVNWLTADGEGGVQIEQSWAARSQHWRAIADAVVEVLGPLI